MMKIVFHNEHCCSTCDKWWGARVMGECCHVYTLDGMPGCCLSNHAHMDSSNSCEAWTLWRHEEVCCQ